MATLFLLSLTLSITSLSAASLDEYDSKSCCSLNTYHISYFDPTLVKVINGSQYPVIMNNQEGMLSFAGYHDDYWTGNESSYDNYTVITNPVQCVINWEWNTKLLENTASKQYFKAGNDSFYAKSSDGTKHGLSNGRQLFHGQKLFQVLYVDCKATAEKYIKQVSVEFEKPSLDFNKIQESNKARTVTFFYTSHFENNSPQSYTENFDYTETKQVSIFMQSSELDETVSSSTWMRSEMSGKNWEASGNAGFRLVLIKLC